MTDEIIASLAFNTVRHVFSGVIGEEEGAGQEHPAVRLKNLTHEEIKHFLAFWEEKSEELGLSGVQIVIAHDSGLDVKPEYLTDPDRSITYYRTGTPSQNRDGLLYVQTKIESDEQGLESMYTIQDRNYLDGSLDVDGIFSAERTLIELCWENAGGNLSRLPSKLPDHLSLIRKFLHSNNLSIAVRRYSAFVYEVCGRLLEPGQGAIDEATLLEGIGGGFWALVLFPDPEWKHNSQDLKRLIVNYRLADLTNPSGVDQEPDELKSRIKDTEFHDINDDPLPDDENSKYRRLCIDYVDTRSSEIRSKIPYEIYLQIFASEVPPPGDLLGERVRREIAEYELSESTISSASRVEEYLGLDVLEGLNDREQDAARLFLEAEPPEESAPGTLPLFELIRLSTLKILKKLAYPSAQRFKNPFIQIIDVLSTFDNPKVLSGAVMEMRLGRGDNEHIHAQGLFAFLFASTLNDLSDISDVDPSGLQFTVADELVQIQDVPELPSTDEEKGELDDLDKFEPIAWEGLPVEFVFSRTNDRGEKEVFDEVLNLLWKPDEMEWLAFFWLMVCAPDRPNADVLLEQTKDDFGSTVSQIAQRLHSISSYFKHQKLDAKVLENGRVDSLLELKNDFFESTRKDGLQIAEISNYIGEWNSHLQEFRNEFIPNGVLEKHLQMFVSQDVVHFPQRSMGLMLATHPLRLRWIGEYFTVLRDLCISALALDLKLNETNDEYFLSNLENFSPHAQPPILANAQRTLMVPVSEHGYSEIFAAIKKDGAVTPLWKSELDQVSLGVISAEITSYLEAHPHKEDGLSILFILPSGGMFPRHLVDKLRQGALKYLPIRCHVFSPKSEWEGLVTAFQELETESRISANVRLDPPLQLFLNDWNGEIEAAEELKKKSYDISVVPNFFGDKIDVNEHAEPHSVRSGKFHVLYDRSDYIDRDADSGTVSIVLKPEMPDEAIQDWSTMNVRLLRSEAIASENPEYTDFVKLRIRFDEAAPLFAVLHACSHWVITLDHYVGRDQIESLPLKPDVLTVKEGVGQNDLYTLVVSSNAGKEFVIKRLARKLDRIAGSVKSPDLNILAQKVYDEIREVAPGLILRSLGVSRVTEEVLGLMVAKKIVESEMPPDSGNAVSIWISLDEHSEWFGGVSSVRADLCRLDFARVEDRLQVGLVVVEGKLRQAYDPHGVDQALRTNLLLRAALEPDGKEVNSADARFWRQSIYHAVLSCSEHAVIQAKGGSGYRRLREDDWEDFLNGDYDFVYARSAFSICLYESFGELQKDQKNGVEIFRSRASEIIDLISGGEGRRYPAQGSEDKLEADHEEIEVRGESSTDDGENSPADNKPANVADPASPPDEDEGTTSTDATSTDEVPTSSHVVRGMSEDKLEEMYQKILDTLGHFKVLVETPVDDRPNYLEGPAFIQFRVKPSQGVNPDAVSHQSKSLHLNLELSQDQYLHFVGDRGTINIDVPKTDQDRYFVDAQQMWEKWDGPDVSRLMVPLGENHEGEIVCIDFSSPNSPHLLIGGATGSGKSEALNTILYGLSHFYSPEQLHLVLIDPKQVELAAFEGAPHLQGDIGYFDDDAVKSLSDAVEEMQIRYRKFKEKGVKSLPEFNANVDSTEQLPWIVVVLDEYADLVAEPDIKKIIEGQMKRLSAKARASGIHVIIATQKPSADNISTTIRSNLPAQIALRCRGRSESNIIMGEAGAEALNGKGDAFVNQAGRLERIQCAMYSGDRVPGT